jgi:hypothetical protein
MPSPVTIPENEIMAAAGAIANERGGRHGVPPIENILELLPEKLRLEVIEDATAALEAVEKIRCADPS